LFHLHIYCKYHQKNNHHHYLLTLLVLQKLTHHLLSYYPFSLVACRLLVLQQALALAPVGFRLLTNDLTLIGALYDLFIQTRYFIC